MINGEDIEHAGSGMKSAAEGVAALIETGSKNRWSFVYIMSFILNLLLIVWLISALNANSSAWKDGYNKGKDDGRENCQTINEENKAMKLELNKIHKGYDSVIRENIHYKEQAAFQQIIIKTRTK